MRLPNWPHRLQRYVDAHRATPFAWGAHDCARFAAGAVRAITGWEVKLPAYVGALQAARVLQGLALADAVDARLGPRQAPAVARRGDVLLLVQQRGPVLAVCLGHLWAAPGPDGLAFGPASDAVASWKVG